MAELGSPALSIVDQMYTGRKIRKEGWKGKYLRMLDFSNLPTSFCVGDTQDHAQAADGRKPAT